MKRPNREDYYEYIDGEIAFIDELQYQSDLEKYIDFLESNQKEFEEWLELIIKRQRLYLPDEILTKYKELNK